MRRRAVIVMYLWSAVISYAATAFVFLNTPTLLVSLTAVTVVALLLTLKLPRLRRDEGSFTGLWRVRR